MASLTQQAYAMNASGYELDVITAIVVGGTSLMGGNGSVIRGAYRRRDGRFHQQRSQPAGRAFRLPPDRHRHRHPRGTHSQSGRQPSGWCSKAGVAPGRLSVWLGSR